MARRKYVVTLGWQIARFYGLLSPKKRALQGACVAVKRHLMQEHIVFLLAATTFAAAAVALPGFFAVDNLVAIVRSVSVLGILAVGMAVIIIGRGIDLSMVAIMAMAAAVYLQMLNDGVAGGTALAIVLAGVIAVGLINGFLIAYADVPAIFATLASASFVYGFV